MFFHARIIANFIDHPQSLDIYLMYVDWETRKIGIENEQKIKNEFVVTFTGKNKHPNTKLEIKCNA